MGTIESKLFSWESWDHLDDQDIVFMEVTLKEPLIKFKKGSKFAYAKLLFSKSRLELGLETPEHDIEVYSFDISLNVDLFIGERTE